MSDYFSKVPDLEYVSRLPDAKISDYITVKNLFKKGTLREDIFQNLALFTKYQIKGEDRPDNVAFDFYGNEKLDWLVLQCNNIINIYTEWPLPQRDFDRYLLDKYETYDNLYNGIHHYETVEVKNSQGVVMLEKEKQVPSDFSITYYDSALGQHASSLITESNITVAVTNYDYEEKIENDKRNIFLLKKRYLNIVKDDMDEIMPYKKGSTQYVSKTLKRGENIRLYQ